MHHRIDPALRRLRQDLAARLDEAAVHDACRAAGHRWRDCLLTPVAILHWFVIQVLHGNTALAHVSLLAGRSFTDAAFCQARARLPLAVFQAVLRGLAAALVPDTARRASGAATARSWSTARRFSMPDTPELRAHFGTSGRARPGCSFPVARILALFHAGTGLLLEVLAVPAAGPRDGVRRRRPPPPRAGRRPGRATAASARSLHLAMLAARGAHAVFRIHPGRSSTSRRTGRTSAATPGRRARAGRGRAGCGGSASATRWSSGSSRRERPEWLAEDEFAALPASLTRPRAAVRRGPARLPHPVGDAGDDAARRRGVPAGGAGRAVRHEVARGAGSEALEDRRWGWTC